MRGNRFRWVLAAVLPLGTWILPPDAASQCLPDTAPPIITCPSNVSLACGGSTDPANTGTPIVNDACDPAPSVEFSDIVDGSCPGSRTITRTWTATDASDNTASCAQTIAVECCTDLFCSLTQGFYGNAGGRFNGDDTTTVLDSLLVTPVVVGGAGRSLRFTPESVSCIIDRLPAGGRPGALPPIGEATLLPPECQTQPPLPLIGGMNDRKPGRFRNVLLGQALTLALNVRLDPDLGALELCNLIVTQLADPGPDGLHGTADDVIDPGPDGLPGTADDTLTVAVPVSVTNALEALGLPLTVEGLLALANLALASEPTGGARPGDITEALGAINSVFDECRFLISCEVPGPET